MLTEDRSVRWVTSKWATTMRLMHGDYEVGCANYMPDDTWEACVDEVPQALFTERGQCLRFLERLACDRGYVLQPAQNTKTTAEAVEEEEP